VKVSVGGVSHFVPKSLFDDKIKAGMDIKKGDPLSLGYVNPHALLASTKDIHAVQNHLTNEIYSGLYEKEGVRKRNIEVAVRALTNLTKIKDSGHSDYLNGDVVLRSHVDEHNRNLPPGKSPILHEPILKGIEQVPGLASQDWMQRLNYRYIHKTIQQGAAEGWKSDLHGVHPIPGMAFGAEFGKAPKGSKPGAY
jgi:DNA-directed RNA polymerase subunit beta'